MKPISITLFFLLFYFLISPTVPAKDYKGAEYRTKNSYLYGRFEVRLKSAYREGMLSSFFTYYDGGTGVGDWNEIDIEILGRYANDIQFNTITPGQVNHVGHYPMQNSPHSDYHIYAFEWTPTYVSWFVDGVEVLKQTGIHIQSLNKAQKLMMNIWNPAFENWAGKFDPNVLPAFAYYDWVKYYAYTPGSGNYGSGNNFTLSWSDEFDSWNGSFWDKATHTWDSNGCDFIYANAVFRDSKLILCLTNSINTGYIDVKAPALLWARASVNSVLVNFSEELDQTAAENKSNYNIQGVVVDSAVLQPDQKSVKLSVTGLDLSTSKNIVVLSMKDRAAVPNISGAAAVAIIIPHQLPFPIKINCGGSAAIGYLPEKQWSQTEEHGYLDGTASTFSSTLQISGTEEDAVYQSERYNMVSYKIRVPNGSYNVKLMFAENYFTASGNRIFDVYIENNRVIENLDIFSRVGKNAAYQPEFQNIIIEDGIIDIYFAGKKDNPNINGILITANPSGSADDEKKTEVLDFKVEQNYPNPFNGKTVIKYSLSDPDNLTLSLYNITGEEIFIKELGYLTTGSYQYVLDTATINGGLSSAVYFYVIKGSRRQEIHKMILLN